MYNFTLSLWDTFKPLLVVIFHPNNSRYNTVDGNCSALSGKFIKKMSGEYGNDLETSVIIITIILAYELQGVNLLVSRYYMKPLGYHVGKPVELAPSVDCRPLSFFGSGLDNVVRVWSPIGQENTKGEEDRAEGVEATGMSAGALPSLGDIARHNQGNMDPGALWSLCSSLCFWPGSIL